MTIMEKTQCNLISQFLEYLAILFFRVFGISQPVLRIYAASAVSVVGFLGAMRWMETYNEILENYARSQTPLGEAVRRAAVKHNAPHLLLAQPES